MSSSITVMSKPTDTSSKSGRGRRDAPPKQVMRGGVLSDA